MLSGMVVVTSTSWTRWRGGTGAASNSDAGHQVTALHSLFFIDLDISLSSQSATTDTYTGTNTEKTPSAKNSSHSCLSLGGSDTDPDLSLSNSPITDDSLDTDDVIRDTGAEEMHDTDSSIDADQLTRLQQMKSHCSVVRIPGHVLTTLERNSAREDTLLACDQDISARLLLYSN